MTDRPSICVVVFDRLGAGWLGPYGNRWVRTPHFNRLAAESLLAEFVIAESDSLDAIYQGYWTGVPAWSSIIGSPENLATCARRAGYRPLLMTDVPSLAALPWAASFDEPLCVSYPAPRKAARELEQTQVCDFFRTAVQHWQPGSTPDLLWLHAGGMDVAWDAPTELAAWFGDEEDPTPPPVWLPPQCQLPLPVDPDLLLGFVHNYAAQVAACDHALGWLVETLAAAGRLENMWLMITSPRGYPLGERGLVGTAGDGLYGEVLQVPWLIRPPHPWQRCSRWPGLWQGTDLFTTLTTLLGTPAGDGVSLTDLAAGTSAPPELALAAADGALAMRCATWFYREAWHAEERLPALYVKPDDRWEVNEVSRRAPAVATACADWLAVWQATRSVAVRRSPELPEALLLPPG
jgi:hypothetical protein